MKVLLDTNIIIHREGHRIMRPDIGLLFNWLDKLQYTKCVHPATLEELGRHKDTATVAAMTIKAGSYTLIRNIAPSNIAVETVSRQVDTNPNDENDTRILNEVFSNRVDLLITEDKKIHTKARMLGIADRVFNIEQFLEKVNSENPDLANYNVLAVHKVDFAHVDLTDPFFDSFREDYDGFDNWFNRKADDVAYVCYHKDILSAFLYIKIESEKENYGDIAPGFLPRKRLKIGTFKVVSNGLRLGERFLKIIFDNALQYKVSEIYVTIFDKRPEQLRLIDLLGEWGFVNHGIKTSKTGQEQVYTKNFDKQQEINLLQPRKTFPFSSPHSKVFIVPIYPEYHTELFPDSILRTESPMNFIENEPHRNALGKVYISRSHEKGLNPGDLIVFYRTGQSGNALHTGVATTIGIVESVITDIHDEATFLQCCRKRSVFTDAELSKHWNYRSSGKPFVVNFIYTHSLRKRPNLKWLNENGVIPDILDMPRGFREISRENLRKIALYSIGK